METELDEAALGKLTVPAAEDDPDALEAEAATLRAAAMQAAGLPGQMLTDAAEKQARAVLLRRRSEAVEAVRVASERVAACERDYAQTEEPERTAAGRAFEALQAVQRAHAARTKGYDDMAANEEIRRLIRVFHDAEEAEEGEAARCAAATKAREQAWKDLEAARTARTRARDALQGMEDQMAQPLAAGLGMWEYAQANLFNWAYRLATAGKNGQPPMSPAERDANRLLAGMFADFAGVIPTGAAQAVAAAERKKAEQAMATMLHSISIPMPDGRQANVGQMIGLPAGQAGR